METKKIVEDALHCVMELANYLEKQKKNKLTARIDFSQQIYLSEAKEMAWTKEGISAKK